MKVMSPNSLFLREINILHVTKSKFVANSPFLLANNAIFVTSLNFQIHGTPLTANCAAKRRLDVRGSRKIERYLPGPAAT